MLPRCRMRTWRRVDKAGSDELMFAGGIGVVAHGPEIDLDNLAGCSAMPPGSIVIRVQTGLDDIVGRRVKAEIFASHRGD